MFCVSPQSTPFQRATRRHVEPAEATELELAGSVTRADKALPRSVRHIEADRHVGDLRVESEVQPSVTEVDERHAILRTLGRSANRGSEAALMLGLLIKGQGNHNRGF